MKALKKIEKEEILKMERRYRAQLINSLGGFKSLALIGTRSVDGLNNLSIVNSVMHLGADPAMMAYIQRPTTVPRHTYQNIKETGYFTFNHVLPEFLTDAHHTSANWQDDEFKACGLNQADSTFPAPFVQESQVRIGLKFHEEHHISNGTILVAGTIETIELPEKLIAADGYLDIAAARSVTVAGLDAYHRAEPIVRLTYALTVELPKPLLPNGEK